MNAMTCRAKGTVDLSDGKEFVPFGETVNLARCTVLQRDERSE